MFLFQSAKVTELQAELDAKDENNSNHVQKLQAQITSQAESVQILVNEKSDLESSLRRSENELLNVKSKFITVLLLMTQMTSFHFR